MKLNQYQLITAGLLALTACSSLALTSTHIYADDTVTDTTNITVPESCSMTGTVNTAHTATLNPGIYSGDSTEFANGIGKTTLTTFCNDNNGFSIYAIGFTDDTLGTTTLVGNNTDIKIPTKVYESGDTTSNWSMKVTKVENPSSGDPVTYNPENMTISNSFSSWHIVPSDYIRVAEYHAQSGSSTTDQALGAKLETTYAAYISQTQAADTYTGKVKYVMVHPYNATAPEILDPLACNTPVQGLTYMQDLNSSNKATILANMETDEQYFLKDKRDEKSYCVAKLRDGNIWMTQNLDHDIVTTENYYTNENTDIGWNYGTSNYDTATWTAERATYPTGTTHWNDYDATDNPTGVEGNVHPESYDPGNIYWNGIARPTTQEACEAASGTWTSWVPSGGYCSDVEDVASTGYAHYHLGNYYNWPASLAMNDSSSISGDGTRVRQSICPAGWTLPIGGYTFSDTPAPDKSFQHLIEQYDGWDSGSFVFWNTAIKLPLSGEWDGSFDDIGSEGSFWPSTSASYTYAEVYGGNNYGTAGSDVASPRHYGYAVRCLAR